MSTYRTLPPTLQTIFKKIDAETFEQFVRAYQLWTLLQRIDEVEQQITDIQEDITENDFQLRWLQPSPVALAAIARFQAYGVDDIDLLDTMLERGETWLDHTLQLLEQCERLGLIGDSYTSWCENALEGAYDWISSMPHLSEEHDLASTSDTTQMSLNDIEQQEHLLAALKAILIDPSTDEAQQTEAISAFSSDDTALEPTDTMKIPATPAMPETSPELSAPEMPVVASIIPNIVGDVEVAGDVEAAEDVDISAERVIPEIAAQHTESIDALPSAGSAFLESEDDETLVALPAITLALTEKAEPIEELEQVQLMDGSEETPEHTMIMIPEETLPLVAVGRTLADMPEEAQEVGEEPLVEALELPDQPALMVVDDGSEQETVEAVVEQVEIAPAAVFVPEALLPETPLESVTIQEPLMLVEEEPIHRDMENAAWAEDHESAPIVPVQEQATSEMRVLGQALQEEQYTEPRLAVQRVTNVESAEEGETSIADGEAQHEEQVVLPQPVLVERIANQELVQQGSEGAHQQVATPVRATKRGFFLWRWLARLLRRSPREVR